MIAVDMFAGLGGFSEGARLAGAHVAWAANHWPEAVRWHSINHPETQHACQDLQQADFRDAPAHDILLASPACQGHSPARGKERPHHDAQRATAWAVVTCLEVHRPAICVVENVEQFASWSLFPAWCAAMHALGYSLAPRLIDAADHGVPQNRVRLFIVATRSRHPIMLKLPKREHVPASSVIDFGAGRWALVRKPGRAVKTLQRYENGRRAFGERFVMPFYGSGSGTTGRSVDRPIGTVTTRARWAAVDGDRMRMVSAAEGRGLMGFSNAYRLPQSEKLGWHLVGNAVAPVVARDVIRALQASA
jgi:DNA (cytosine-5)-methyltransferase 1